MLLMQEYYLYDVLMIFLLVKRFTHYSNFLINGVVVILFDKNFLKNFIRFYKLQLNMNILFYISISISYLEIYLFDILARKDFWQL